MQRKSIGTQQLRRFDADAQRFATQGDRRIALVDETQQMGLQRPQSGICSPAVLDGAEPCERRRMAALLHFDVGGAQMMREGVWRPGDRCFCLWQGLVVPAEVLQITGMAVPHVGVPRHLVQHAREFCICCGRVAEPATDDREIGSRLPKTGFQAQGEDEVSPGLLELQGVHAQVAEAKERQ